MRLATRVTLPLLSCIGIAACSDSATSVNRRPAQVALAPRFSTQAAAIYRSLSTFAVTLDNVHIVVRAPTSGDALGALLADTTIGFPATANEITIGIDLAIQGSEQPVVATVELRSGTTVYFHGAQSLVARTGQTSGTAEPVEMLYVGPGAAATSLVITPTVLSQAVTLAPSSSFTFAVQAFDQQHQLVSDLPVTWSVSDLSTATVTQNGVVTSTGKAGSLTLTVTGINGVSGSAPVHVQPVSRLSVIQGDNQTATAGTALTTKLSVQAFDAAAELVAGATVNFAVVDGRGTVSPASATTDVGGVASTTMTLGQAIGTYVFTATVAGTSAVTTRVAATATSGVAAALGIVAGNNQSDTVRTTLGQPLSVKVADSFGNPVSNVPVTFQVTAGRAFLGAPTAGAAPVTSLTVATGTDGVATTTLVADTLAGTVRVTAFVSQTTIAPVSFTATVKPGAPAQLVMLQQPSSKAQATLALGTQPKVQIADQFGNAVARAGVPIDASAVCTVCQLKAAVRIAVPSTPVRTQSVSDTFPRGLGGKTEIATDANGVATFSDLALNEFVAPWQLQFFVQDQSLAPAFSAPIDLAPGPATSIIAWDVSDTTFVFASVDTLFPSVRVIDKVGNGIPNVSVSWNVTDRVTTIDSTSTHTDADGIARPGMWIIPANVGTGPFTIVATPSGNLENAPLTLFSFIQLIGQANMVLPNAGNPRWAPGATSGLAALEAGLPPDDGHHDFRTADRLGRDPR
jgi:hypothetical protein